MGEATRSASLAGSAVAFAGGLSLTGPVTSADNAGLAESGEEVASDRGKGDCLACHIMDHGEARGNIGPPPVAMQARFPDEAKLRT